MKINKKNHLCKICSMRGVRKEINYSEPCSNAPDKAQMSLGCPLAALACAQMGTTQTQLCFILRHLSTVRNNLFLNSLSQQPSIQSVKSPKGKQMEPFPIMANHVFMFALCCSQPLHFSFFLWTSKMKFFKSKTYFNE